jgi:hypothetical protein
MSKLKLFLDLLHDNINPSWFSINSSLTPDIVDNCYKFINPIHLINNPSLNLDYLASVIDFDYYGFKMMLSTCTTLTETDIISFAEVDAIDWNILSQNPSITYNIIIKYEKYINFNKLHLSRIRDIRILDEFNERLNWRPLSTYVILTDEIITKYHKKFDIDALFMNRSLKMWMVVKYYSKNINRKNISYLFEYCDYSYSFIDMNLHLVNWAAVSKNINLSMLVWKRYKKFLDKSCIFSNTNLTLDMMLNYLEFISWERISANPKLIEIIGSDNIIKALNTSNKNKNKGKNKRMRK